MDPDVLAKLSEMEQKIDAVYKSSKNTEKYFKWTFIATIVFFVLPLIASLFLIPTLMSTYSSMYSGLY